MCLLCSPLQSPPLDDPLNTDAVKHVCMNSFTLCSVFFPCIRCRHSLAQNCDDNYDDAPVSVVPDTRQSLYTLSRTFGLLCKCQRIREKTSAFNHTNARLREFRVMNITEVEIENDLCSFLEKATPRIFSSFSFLRRFNIFSPCPSSLFPSSRIFVLSFSH